MSGPLGWRGDSLVLPGEREVDEEACKHCGEHDRGPDVLCPRCAENLDAQEGYRDVAELVLAARAHLNIYGHWSSDLGHILDRFPELEEARR